MEGEYKVIQGDWKERRINAINRKIKNSKNPRAMTEAYMCEYDRVYKSTCKTKKEYKTKHEHKTS